MSYQTVTQIFRQGGINGTAGTPNFLRAIDRDCVRVDWTDIQMGGLQVANMEMVKTYEDTIDFQGGNWMYYGCLGGLLNTSASAGASSIIANKLAITGASSTIPSSWNTTLNPADVGSPMTLSGGNLVATIGATGGFRSGRTFASMSSGRWYWEVTVTNIGSGGTNECIIGMGTSGATLGSYIGSDAFGWGYDSSGQKQHGGTGPSYGASYTTGAVLGFALDLVAGTLTFYKNGVSQGVAFTGLSGTFFPMVSGGQNAVMTCNFAGPFLYTPPAGYLNTPTDIIAGDYFLITDGANTDLMTASTVTDNGDGTHTIALSSAPGQGTATLLNAYAAGSVLALLQFSGYLLARDTRTTELTGKYVVKAQGFASRYNNVLCNGDIVSQDCADSIYRLCQSYSTTLPEIIISSGNFAAPNSILGTSQSQDGQVLKVIGDLVKTENAKNANINYAFWVDAARQAHHALVPGANTPNGTGNIGDPGASHASPTYAVDLVLGNTLGDSLGPLEVTDMDMSQMVNTAIVNGGKTSSKQNLKIIVQDTTSQAAWGYWEGSFSNPDLTDETTAAQWGAGQLSVTAYPRTTAKLSFISASTRLTCRDLLQITGFNDSSVIQLNPTQIQYVADNRQRLVSATCDLAQQRPDIGSIIMAGASQTSLRAVQGSTTTNLDTVYVVSGFTLSFVGLVATIASGVVNYNGTLYSIPSWTYTLGSNELVEPGVQVSGTPLDGATLPSVVRKPHVAGLSTIIANNVYSVTRPVSAGSPVTVTATTNFIGTSLYRITSRNGAIVGTKDFRTIGGVGGNNLLANPLPATAPVVSGVSAFTYANVGASCFDCSINFTVDKGNPPWLYGVNLYAVNHGAASPTNVTTPWSQITGLKASGAYTGASFLGLTAGISGGWDIYAAYVDQQGNVSPAALIATTAANPQVVGSTIMAAMPSALKTSGPTITSSSVTSRTTDVGMTQSCLIAFTETDFTAIPSWMDSVLVCTRVHGTTIVSKQIAFDPRAVLTGIYTNVPAQAGVGETVDFGLAYQDMTGAISTIVWPSALSNSSDSDGGIIDPTGPGRPIKYPRTPVAVQNVIDSSSNLLNVEFAGGKLQANGALTNVDGISSTTLYPLATATVFTAQANIAKGGASVSGILLGNTTNGYRVYYDSAGHVGIDKYVGGVNSSIGTLVSETNDTNYHTLKLTVAVLGASNNLIQATWDGVDPNNAANPGGIVDTSINLTSGTWPVTLHTGGSTGKVTGYAANTALDHYVKLAPIVKKRIGGDGTLAIDSTTGPISGTLPLVNHASPVQAQLDASAGSDGSFLASGSVSSRHVQAQSVAGTQTLPTRYSTQQTNASYGGVSWATASTGGSAIAPTTTLTNGQMIYYNTGSGSYGGSGLPAQTAYNVPASGSITCLFTHNAFISGGNGLPRVYFTGSSSGGGTTTLQTSGVSGTSAGSAGGASYGSPLPSPHYTTGDGAVVTFSATTSVAVSGTNPISLNLTSVTCPSDGDGGVKLTVTLKNPGGSVVQTWTGITSSASFPLTYSTAGASGTWVWTVQAIAYNNDVVADIPYGNIYTASFSGTVSYWQTTGASGNTYVLASDGSTQRINALDGNVQFAQIAPDTIAFKVFNSATSALSFIIGVDVGGV